MAVASLAAVMEEATESAPLELELTRASDIRSRPVDWLWFSYFAAGELNICAGLPGMSKSTLTCEIAAAVTNCTAWPDGAQVQQGDVLIWNVEDHPATTIRPRLEAAGADRPSDNATERRTA